MKNWNRFDAAYYPVLNSVAEVRRVLPGVVYSAVFREWRRGWLAGRGAAACRVALCFHLVKDSFI